MMINKLFMGCRGLLKYIFDRKAGSENVPVAERKIFYVSLSDIPIWIYQNTSILCVTDIREGHNKLVDFTVY